MARVPLTKGGYGLIDDADVVLLGKHKWFELRIGDKHKYVGTGCHSRILLHRVIMGAGKGQVVDHINGNGLDNRRENLRLCTFAQNLRNRKRSRSSSHKYKGIGQGRHKTRYVARIRLNGKRETIGWFDTAEEAAAAYDIAAVLRHGEFACLNFPHVFPEISQRSA